MPTLNVNQLAEFMVTTDKKSGQQSLVHGGLGQTRHRHETGLERVQLVLEVALRHPNLPVM